MSAGLALVFAPRDGWSSSWTWPVGQRDGGAGAQLERERERARARRRSGPERRAGEERDNCWYGHDVGEREKGEGSICFGGTNSLRTFRHAAERCGPGERGAGAKAASERETSGRSEGTRVLNGHHLARAGLCPESWAPQDCYY
jgi:hypothetical protein